jgi:hypothetical protein
MQPTEHKHKKDVELIDHIKQSLQTHEELYQLGAWERFNELQQQPKRRPFFWITRISAAAAILAICVTLIWYTNTNPQKEQLAKTDASKGVKSAVPQQLNGDAPEVKEQLAGLHNEQEGVETSRNIIEDRNDLKHDGNLVAQAVAVAVPSVSNNQSTVVTNPPVIDNQQAIIAQVEEKTSLNTADFLASESQRNSIKQDKFVVDKKQGKWDMGLMLAPSFGNANELNMGYGISMSYNFSDRLSLTSGIAYNKMSASKNLPTNIGMASIIVGNTKSLEMISEEVTGLDIPLELKYNINKNVYANFGISGFAVLNQRRSNTFVEQVVIKSNNTPSGNASASAGSAGASSSIDPSKGQFANAYITNQRTTERAASSALQDVNYLGFYNFSFGYTKKVYKNHSLSIEPFVKLPIKVITQDNLKLMGTGLRLKVGF